MSESATIRPLSGRMLQIVSGLTELSSRDVQKYRELMERQGHALPELKVNVPVVRHHATGQSRVSSSTSFERVGTALKSRIEGLLSIKATNATCGCQTLATEMDRWGITGCESRRDHIVGQLMEKADMLGVSLSKATVAYVRGVGIVAAAGAASTLVGDWWSGKDVEQEAKRAGANWLLTRAIEDVRSQLSRGKPGYFAVGAEPARFITSAQFQHDIKALLAKVPSDITAIAGVARSGLSVATMLAMYLQLPMITIRQTMNDIVPTGNGWRLGGSRHVDPAGKILVVDDTVMTGNSLKAIRPLVTAQLGNAVYAAVYVNPTASLKPDIWAVDLPWPHILEWNIFNSVLSPSVAVDFDGILCHDCRPEQDDDGEKYLDFVRNAPPLYVPRKSPIPLIVTARIERYRHDTEAWLRRYGIQWKTLVMHPAATLHQRNQTDIAAYKASHYQAWAAQHRASPGPVMFFESDDRQAQRIAQISGRMVICPHTAGVY